MTLQQLTNVFAESVVAYHQAVFKGDAKTANKHANKQLKAFVKLKAQGDAGRDALCVLFGDPRPGVRVAAAAFLLRYRTEQAKAVLQEAATHEGLIAFEAEETLKRWEEGTWALDPG